MPREDLLTPAELDKLYAAEGRSLYNYSLALCGSPDLAQDIMQDVFLKFIESVKQGKIVRATAPNYLMRMARNRWIDHTRRARREVGVDGADLDRIAAAPIKGHADARVLEVLTAALADPELPEQVRDVLRLRFWEHRRVADICQVLGRPRSSVYATLKTGVSHLVRAFRAAGIQVEGLDDHS